MIFIKKTSYCKMEVSFLGIKPRRNSKWWKAGLSLKNKISMFLSFMILIKRILTPKSQNQHYHRIWVMQQHPIWDETFLQDWVTF